MTELVTALGMFGHDSVAEALSAEPREMVSVSPELWRSLRELEQGGALRAEFRSAWENGRAFLRAKDALRGRRPAIVEWKGSTRAPGDEVVPADLRIDHVYLVSCKYLSRIVLNASPHHLFDRLLVGGHGTRGADWYQLVAPTELERLYQATRAHLDRPLPKSVEQLRPTDRSELASALKGRWPSELRGEARRFSAAVAQATAQRWQAAIVDSKQPERMVWRLLRIGSAPYFVLGADRDRTLRLRIHTPWDWSQAFRLVDLEVGVLPSEQPVISWAAQIVDRATGHEQQLLGHVEVRWSHGKFKAPPEAKVYLDTPHHLVPGYVTLA